MEATREPLGEMLVDAGAIDRQQLDEALKVQQQCGGRLGAVLVGQLLISEDQLADTVAGQHGLERIELANYPVDLQAVSMLPERVARRREMLPVGFADGQVLVAMADPLDLEAIDEIEMRTGMTARVLCATSSQIRFAIDKYISSQDAFQKVVLAAAGEDTETGEDDDLEAELAAGGDLPVVRLVNELIHGAVQDRASDIHFEPMATDVIIRYRVDGVLHEVMRLPRSARAAMTSRIKIMSDMDIAERRRPQDGRIRAQVDGRSVDFRVATIPTPHGESIVIRVLNQSLVPVSLEEVGMGADHLATVEALLAHPYGAVLVSGPTGSGKSTTMYAALQRIADVTKKVITVEEPVEFLMNGITQMPVNTAIGLTFAAGLRQILRSDPDIVMVGEIRDAETAEIAIRAALTGHLVLSSIHTNDAPSALTRLTDMGVPPYITASALLAVVAQRLARRLCPECKRRIEAPIDVLVGMGMDPARAATAEVYEKVGCDRCFHTGYRGRLGLFELMVMDDELRKLSLQGELSNQMRQHAIDHGMRTLLQDGLEKVAQGLTSIEEMSRVVM